MSRSCVEVARISLQSFYQKMSLRTLSRCFYKNSYRVTRVTCLLESLSARDFWQWILTIFNKTIALKAIYIYIYIHYSIEPNLDNASVVYAVI